MTLYKVTIAGVGTRYYSTEHNVKQFIDSHYGKLFTVSVGKVEWSEATGYFAEPEHVDPTDIFSRV